MSIANINTSVSTTYASGTTPNAEVNRPQTGSTAVDTRQATADVQAKAAKVAESKPSAQEIRDATEKLSEYIDLASRSLNISVDRELREPVVTVFDAETEEIVRQIPSEELVAIAKFLRQQEAARAASEETLTGVLLREAT